MFNVANRFVIQNTASTQTIFWQRASVVGCLVWMFMSIVPASAEVRIDGVDGDTQAVVLAFLSIDELPCDAPQWWIEYRLKQLRPEIGRAMGALGFYNPEVTTTLDRSDACWTLRVAIKPGDQVRVRSFDLEIDEPLANEPLVTELRTGKGLVLDVPFSHEAYEGLKEQLLDTAQDLGYFDAEFSRHQVRIDPVLNAADIDLAIAGGARYRIGEILTDQTALEPELFARYLRIREGQPYDARDLLESYKNLSESDYFSRVLITPLVDSREDGLVPVRVAVVPSPRRLLQLGGGYATDTGPRVRGDVTYRRLNDRGHRASTNTLLSTLVNKVALGYRLPYGDPLEQWLFAEASYNDEETDTSESKSYAVGVGRNHRRGRHWTETNHIDYTVTDFSVGDQHESRSNLLILGSSWGRTSAIDAPRPLSGYSINLDLRGSVKQLLSDNDFLQLIVRAKHILPLGNRIRLLSRINAGWIQADEFEELPPSVRFFAGGDNSVRGYEYESLGPEENGDVVGGRKLLTGSLEADIRIRNNWSLALFVDSGSAFDGNPEFSTGVGAGIRWYSPLGPVRLDLAHPLDDPDTSIRIHFSLGPDL